MDRELVQYLNERFGRIEQRLDGHDQRFEQIDRRFAGIDRRFEGIDRRFDEVNDRIEEVKRHSGVLIEDLRYQVRLVAEGFAVFVDGRYAQDQVNIDHRFDETNALIRSSYDHLNQRIENLERKGQD